MGKAKTGTVLLTLLVLLVAAGVIMGGMAFFGAKETLKIGDDRKTPVMTNNCGDAKTSTLSLTVINREETTSSEPMNVTAYFYDSDGSLVTYATETDNGDDVTLVCGQYYMMKLISADGDNGDNAKLYGVRASSGLKNVAIRDGGKYVEFYTNSPFSNLEVENTKHGNLDMKVYDNLAAGWVFETQSLSTDTAGTYINDPAIFSSTVNGTNYTVGTAGKIDVTYKIQSNATDTRFDDFGWYIAVDAATTVWEIPTVKVEGTKLSDIKGTLNVYEARAYSGYEYIFFTTQEVVDDDVKIDFQIKALAGVNPGVADSPQVDFISKGAVKMTAGNDILYAGVGDDTGSTTVFAVQDTTIAVA